MRMSIGAALIAALAMGATQATAQIDAYDVVCGEVTTTLYLDMYHCAQDRPTFSPKGFGIID